MVTAKVVRNLFNYVQYCKRWENFVKFFERENYKMSGLKMILQILVLLPELFIPLLALPLSLVVGRTSHTSGPMAHGAHGVHHLQERRCSCSPWGLFFAINCDGKMFMVAINVGIVMLWRVKDVERQLFSAKMLLLPDFPVLFVLIAWWFLCWSSVSLP